MNDRCDDASIASLRDLRTLREKSAILAGNVIVFCWPKIRASTEADALRINSNGDRCFFTLSLGQRMSAYSHPKSDLADSLRQKQTSRREP